MQWILIVVTLASLVTAGALAALLWRMTRDERERSRPGWQPLAPRSRPPRRDGGV